MVHTRHTSHTLHRGGVVDTVGAGSHDSYMLTVDTQWSSHFHLIVSGEVPHSHGGVSTPTDDHGTMGVRGETGHSTAVTHEGAHQTPVRAPHLD